MSVARSARVPRESIKKIVKNGRRFRSGQVTVIFSENRQSFSRIAVIISSKAVKKSVLRNRLRRMAKEIFKKNAKVFNKNYDIIIMFYSGEPFKFADLEKVLSEVFRKAKVV